MAKTILRNTLSNWTGMVLTTVITILLTPYLLEHLGSERYGIYSLAFAVLHYLVLLEFGIRGSVARFAAKYIRGKDPESLSSVVSAATMFAFVLGTLSILISYVVGVIAMEFFDVSLEYQHQALVMFMAMGVNLMLSLLSYSLSGVLIGSQRYDLQNIKVAMVPTLNAGFVVLFFSLGWISLAAWAVSLLLASLTGLCYLYVTAKCLQPQLRIRPSSIRLETLKEMLGFGGWNVLLQTSTLITSSANPIIIGHVLGSAAVPFYSIPFMLITRLQAGVVGLTSTLMPHASEALNSGNKSLLAHLLKKGTYTSALLVFPLGGCLLVMCRQLFHVWLQPQYEPYWVVFAIFMASYFGSITQTTSYYILLGGGEIKGMAIMYLTGAVGIVVLAIYFMKVLSLGVFGAALALTICRFFSACLFQPWYASRQVGLDYWAYLRHSYLRPTACTLPSLALAALLMKWLPPSNLFFWAIEYIIALLPFVVLILTGVIESPVHIKTIQEIQRTVLNKIGLLKRVQ